MLEELAAQHDICRYILDWRGLAKLKGTYIDALPSLVNPETGRVHTQISQAVAATGRLSSSDPNLQNIPIRTEIGRQIRSAFIADPGHVLISADYSQIELRVLAHLSGDETLTAAFARGDDIHDQTANKVFGPDSTLDPHELRRRAKIINYALLYGKTAFTLAKDIGVTQQAAQQFIDAYFAGFPRVRAFIDKTLEDAQASGVVKTMFGRRRPVPELTSRNFQIRAGAERIAVNMPIQGTAADILKRAMIDVNAALTAANPRARMILTVHDELLFEAPKEEVDDVSALVREKMSGAVKLSVPLDVDVGVGEELARGQRYEQERYLFPAFLNHGPFGSQIGFRRAAFLGGRDRTRSGMMPSSTNLSRSARNVADRLPASRARTQPAMAASQAANGSPAPRVPTTTQYAAAAELGFLVSSRAMRSRRRANTAARGSRSSASAWRSIALPHQSSIASPVRGPVQWRCRSRSRTTPPRRQIRLRRTALRRAPSGSRCGRGCRGW